MRLISPVIKQRLASIRGLVTVPGGIVLVLWMFAVLFVLVDEWLRADIYLKKINVLVVDYDTALSVLGTIAAGAITTLSLVYSLMLVVFTLAAGNIAPRLLQRFTRDSVSQVTAGMLGGTFLFSLSVLHQTRPDFVPGLSIAVAFVLSALTVLQLIYFVHEVSRSVTIDEEIAEISDGLERRLNRLIALEPNQESSKDEELPQLNYDIYVHKSGYLTNMDEDALLSMAVEHDLKFRILEKPGNFLLKGQKVASCNFDRSGVDFEEEKFCETFLNMLTIAESRGAANDDVEYAINMLIEIALRALSPGVNDTFTAIACVDQMTAAFNEMVKSELRNNEFVDDNGNLRVVINGYEAADIFNTAFSPIRRACRDNFLMAQNLGDAILRLHKAASKEHKKLLETQLKLLLQECEQANWLPEDNDFIIKRYTLET
ncbi:DUF2254 domain-containing protein [Ahrensia marina]|uniref:DUF2254 domain-containing protein n=1 Tax=Ahrensia marina TaxID=1514904 RepID=UPI0006B42D02|nr:DUF2254 domain-containing protein [Ahrensia marina]